MKSSVVFLVLQKTMHRGRAAHMSRKDLWGPSFSPLADLEALHTQKVKANAEL